jgi:hypothetical protein
MTAEPEFQGDLMDPSDEEAELERHSPEPWTQEGRYLRDASGAIVVRGRRFADARRIAAAINATRDIPTEALERWLVQDVSNPQTRPELEIDLNLGEPSASPYAVQPPDRRMSERRRRDRRSDSPSADAPPLLFDRRVMERRFGDRRTKR